MGDSVENVIEACQSRSDEEEDNTDQISEDPVAAGKEFLRALLEAKPGDVVFAE